MNQVHKINEVTIDMGMKRFIVDMVDRFTFSCNKSLSENSLIWLVNKVNG